MNDGCKQPGGSGPVSVVIARCLQRRGWRGFGSDAVGSNPLVTSLADPAGTITTTVDLLGRPVSVTDVWGVVTTSVYDSVGRRTGTTITKGAVSSARTVDYDAWGRVTTSR